jgi:hypothetical protein
MDLYCFMSRVLRLQEIDEFTPQRSLKYAQKVFKVDRSELVLNMQ